MVKKQVTLVFPQELIKEPVIYTMSKKYGLMPNIRRARITDIIGEVTLEIEGEEESLEKGIKFLEDKGIKVEPVVGDVIT